MAHVGNNIRSVAPLSSRERIRSFWQGVFGCRHLSPRVDLDVFEFEDGSRLGVYLVADGDALTAERQRDAGTWIEICVGDRETMQAAIVAAGVERVPHHDDGHRYFQAPGGQVFRLAG